MSRKEVIPALSLGADPDDSSASGLSATPEDIAAFAASHLAELRDLSTGARLPFLAYLIDLARIEAEARSLPINTSTPPGQTQAPPDPSRAP